MQMRKKKIKVQRPTTTLSQSQVQFLRTVLQEKLRELNFLAADNAKYIKAIYEVSTPETEDGQKAFKLLNYARNIDAKRAEYQRKLETVQRTLGKMR